MEDTTLFILQLLGPAFILGALGMFLNTDSYKKMMKKLNNDSLAFLVISFATLVIGMTVILKHNLWETPGEIIVSLFGWLAAVKGGLLILSPKAMVDFSNRVVSGVAWKIAPVIWLLLGGYVTWLAYFV